MLYSLIDYFVSSVSQSATLHITESWLLSWGTSSLAADIISPTKIAMTLLKSFVPPALLRTH